MTSVPVDINHIVARLLFSILVFPGLLFIVSLGLFSEWFLRKIVARMQNRMGPSYVGPFGILQPLADLIKLVASKEEIRQKYSMLWLGKSFVLLGVGAIVASLLLLPLSPLRFTAPYDFIVYLYLCCVIVPMALVFVGLSTPNPYTGVGVSRLLSMMLICEPTYSTAVFVPVFLVSMTTCGDGFPEFSIILTAYNSWKLWLNPVTATALLLSLVAAIVVIQARAFIQPFNIPDAEQEIIAGFETELSGPVLGFTRLLHNIELAASIIFVTYLFLGGPYPYTHTSVEGVLVLIAKYMLILFIISLFKGVFGRFRIEQGLRVLFKYGLTTVVTAVILASLAIVASGT